MNESALGALFLLADWLAAERFFSRRVCTGIEYNR